MNYDKIYQKLIAAAKHRGTDKSKLDGYYERHHIVPKCLGGNEDEANLVLLTTREHFVAHRLLAKAHPGNSKLLFAVASFQMGSGERLTSRQVALAREANAAALSQRNAQLAAEGKHNFQTAEAREALSQRHAQLVAEGRHNFQTAEHREALRRRSAERCAQLAAEGKHPAQAAEFREAQSRRCAQLAAEGKHPAQAAEFREAQSRRMSAKATCPYCGKVGGGAGMRRWHFENCKHKEQQACKSY